MKLFAWLTRYFTKHQKPLPEKRHMAEEVSTSFTCQRCGMLHFVKIKTNGEPFVFVPVLCPKCAK